MSYITRETSSLAEARRIVAALKTLGFEVDVRAYGIWHDRTSDPIFANYTQVRSIGRTTVLARVTDETGEKWLRMKPDTSAPARRNNAFLLIKGGGL